MPEPRVVTIDLTDSVDVDLPQSMAADLARDGDALYCQTCAREELLDVAGWASYLRHGWPECHGQTMRLVRANDVRVVNVKSARHYDLYIGRTNRRHGLARSPWHNPFRLGRDGDRAAVLAAYEAYVRGRPGLMARLPELRGKTVACWCAPAGCHGDVLAKLVREVRDE